MPPKKKRKIHAKQSKEIFKGSKIKFRGKVIFGEMAEIIKKVAKKKKMTPSQYLRKNYKDVEPLLESAYLKSQPTPDKLIGAIKGIERKTIIVNDLDGETRYNKNEVIKQIAEFEQYIKSNSQIVYVGITMLKNMNMKAVVKLPRKDQYEGLKGDKLKELLDEFEIWYVESPKKGKKRGKK